MLGDKSAGGGNGVVTVGFCKTNLGRGLIWLVLDKRRKMKSSPGMIRIFQTVNINISVFTLVRTSPFLNNGYLSDDGVFRRFEYPLHTSKTKWSNNNNETKYTQCIICRSYAIKVHS